MSSKIEYDGLGYVAATFSGIRCGAHGRYVRVFHASVDAVRECYAILRAEEAEARAEAEAEQAYERYLEDRGADESYAQDQYETAYGVIGFQEAWDLAGR